MLADAFFIPSTALGHRDTDEILLANVSNTGRADEGAVAEAQAWMQRGGRLLAQDPQAAARCFQELSGSRCMTQLHSCHHLRLELALALVSASGGLGESYAAVRGEWSLTAIRVMEAVLQHRKVALGTPALGSMYASHAASLAVMLRSRDGGHGGAADAPALQRQCVAALQAAAKIRMVCFGQESELARRTSDAIVSLNARFK